MTQKTRTLTCLALIGGVSLSVITARAMETEGSPYHRIRQGDINGDGFRDISDATAFLAWLFRNGPKPRDDNEDLPGDVAAQISEQAAGILAKLPSPEATLQIPDSAKRRGLTELRRVLSSAVLNAASWGQKDLASYGSFLRGFTVVAVVDPNLVVNPNACFRDCNEAWDSCDQSCGGDVVCQITCYARYLDCRTECWRSMFPGWWLLDD